jgi:hypothetical protein
MITSTRSAPERAQKRPGRLQTIVLTLLMFLLVIVTLEIVMRTTHLFGAKMSYAEPDYRLGWRFTPGRSYWHFKENDHPISGTINRFGYRDRDWTIEKPENVYRIAVLGDSYVVAFQVELDSTFLALTEQRLNQAGRRRVEFMNFGRPGYTQTEQLVILEEEVVQFSPDMVMLVFLPDNDITDVRRQTSPDVLRPFYSVSGDGRLDLDTSFADSPLFKIKVRINWLKQRSALLSLLTERFNLYQRQRRLRQREALLNEGEASAQKHLDPVLTLCTANPLSPYLESYRLNKVLIKAMAEYCAGKGFAFMLVMTDTPAYLPEREQGFLDIDPTFDLHYFEDDLASYAETLGIEYLGLQRVFRQEYLEHEIPLHWGHWNYRGHRVVSEALGLKLEPIIHGQEP